MKSANTLVARRGVLLALVIVLTLLPRLALLTQTHHPGMWDPVEYYSLGVNLHEGKGFTLDYIWSFASDPVAVSHPLDYWLPLPGILVAGAFALFGVSVHAALLPFALLGTLQSVLVYAFAGRIGGSRAVQFFSALAAGWVPWLFLSSLHTDTTTLFGVLAFGLFYAVYRAVTEDGRWLWAAGVLLGLATLTRNDASLLLPVSVVGGLWLWWRGPAPRIHWTHLAGAVFGLGIVLLPWMIRNQSALGAPWPSGTMQTLFLAEHEDLYVYSREISLDTYLALGLPHIAGKIIFELMASVKLMIVLLDQVFPVAVLGGLLMLAQRGIQLLTTPHDAASDQDVAPLDTLKPYLLPLLFVLAAWLVYGVLFPIHSQGGSFKKAYLAMIPFLVILGVRTVERVIPARRIFYAAMLLTLGVLLANAVELTRADFKYNHSEQESYEVLGVVLDRLQAEDEREVIVMTRDPWSVNLVTGYRAVMIPSEPLDVILEAADRYGVTYILTPSARPVLDAIDYGEASDPRLERVAELPQIGRYLYRILPPAEASP